MRNNPELLPAMLVFAAVVREGSFTKAARALGLSKSKVSKDIARLEDELGVSLLERSTRAIRLTTPGEHFFERCNQLESLAATALDELDPYQEEVVGNLRISIPVNFSRDFLQEPLTAFLRDHPGVQAEIDVSDRQVDFLRENFDIAIRLGQSQSQNLVVRKLMDSRRIVVGSCDYFARHGEPKHPRELSEHECLLYTYQAEGDRWRFREGTRDIDVAVRGRVRCNSGDFLLASARQGLGLAWVPDFLARADLHSGALRMALSDHCQEESGVYAVVPSRKHLPRRTRELIEVLSDSLREHT